MSGEPGLFQYVADASETRGQRLEVFGLPNIANGLKAFLDIGKIIPAGREHRVDFVVFETANVAEVITDALRQKFRELHIAFAERLDRQPQLAFDQNPDNALRGA